MFRQVTTFRKRLITTRELAFERLVSRMDAFMDRQTSRDAERFAATGIVAHVWTLLGVRTHVLRKRVGLAESLVADFTFVWAVACRSERFEQG